MTSRLLRPPGLYPGAPYAYGVVAEAGSLVLTAGACPIDDHGAVVAPGDPAAQATRAVDNLFTTLAEAGVGAAAVQTTIYVATTEQADLLKVWKVVHDAFGPHEPPSTLVGVTVLGYTGQLVEIEATAIAPRSAGTDS